MNDYNELRSRLVHLEVEVEDGHKKLRQSLAATPVTIIGKERKGQKGRPRWSFYIYELIMEMLVSGTPLSSINGNIIAHVKAIAPTITINKLPSIWTIRCTQIVVLIITEALAAYRLGKSKRWQQLFTDATTRQQTSFTNLAISIHEKEDNDIFTSLLLSCSIYSPNESSEAVVMSIVNTLKDKGDLLDKWRDYHRTMFGEDHEDHAIPSADSLGMSKLAEGESK